MRCLRPQTCRLRLLPALMLLPLLCLLFTLSACGTPDTGEIPHDLSCTVVSGATRVGMKNEDATEARELLVRLLAMGRTHRRTVTSHNEFASRRVYYSFRHSIRSPRQIYEIHWYTRWVEVVTPDEHFRLELSDPLQRQLTNFFRDIQ